MLILITALTSLLTFAAHPATQKLSPCSVSFGELRDQLKSKPSSPAAFKWAKDWRAAARADADFDGDGKPDALILAQRTFHGFGSEEDAKSGENEGDFGAYFLLAWLSHGGTPALVLPKGASYTTSPEEMFDVTLTAAKNVATLVSDSSMSSGSWWATTSTQKWRANGTDFQMIGLTVLEHHRSTGEENTTDENLLTGKKIVTNREGSKDEEGDSPGKSTSKTEKTKPRKVLLSEWGDCKGDDPIWVRR